MEYRFDRYRNGRKMAEGLVLTKPKTADDAVAVASRLGEAGDVFVLREDLTRLAAAEAERDAARAEAAELQSLFDLQRKRMDAARALWQQAHPDKENVWPDLGDLLAWLMQEWDAALKENSQLRLVLATSNAKCAYCGLPAEEMAKCASGFPGCARGDDMLSDNTPTRRELVAERDAAEAYAEHCRAERDALQETITACEKEVAEVYDFATHGKFAKMNTSAVVIIDEINDERRKLEDERDVARAERDAAQAEAARAVEALRKLSERVVISAKDSFGTCDEWLDSFRLNFPDECAAYEEAVAVLSASEPALDWLARVKREAAAEALEQLATDIRRDLWSYTLSVDSLSDIVRERAAALRATKEDSDAANS